MKASSPRQRFKSLGKDLREHLRWMVKEPFSEQHIDILLGSISARFPEETLNWVIIRADMNRSAGLNERARTEREPGEAKKEEG